MKWIKASERVPEDWCNVVVQCIDTKELIVSFHYNDADDFIYRFGMSVAKDKKLSLDSIQWLDESAESEYKGKCPKCGGELIPTEFEGYYDQMNYWDCENDCLLPSDCSYKIRGSHA